MHLKNLSETKFESDEPGLGWRNFKTRQYSGGIGVPAHCPYPVCSERSKGSRRTWKPPKFARKSLSELEVVAMPWQVLSDKHYETEPSCSALGGQGRCAKSKTSQSLQLMKRKIRQKRLHLHWGAPEELPCSKLRKVFSQMEPARRTILSSPLLWMVHSGPANLLHS